MYLNRFLFLCFFLSSFCLAAQKSQLEVGLGSEFGWWVHELGSENPDAFSDLGVTKTHHTPAPFISSSWLWKINRWKIGPSVQGGLFFETQMRTPSDSRDGWERIRIAKKDGFVPIFRYGIHIEYQLIKRGRYTLAPAFRYGAFQWNTLHPKQDNFGYKHFSEIIFYHIWHFKKRDLFLRMNYDTLRVFLKEKNNPFEKHYLYFWGTSFGIRF